MGVQGVIGECTVGGKRMREYRPRGAKHRTRETGGEGGKEGGSRGGESCPSNRSIVSFSTLKIVLGRCRGRSCGHPFLDTFHHIAWLTGIPLKYI